MHLSIVSYVYATGVNYIHKDMVHSAAKVWREERKRLIAYNHCYTQFSLMVLTLVAKFCRPATPLDRCKDGHFLHQIHQAFLVVKGVLSKATFTCNIELMQGDVSTHT